jgi:hypothetical protein
MKKFHPQLEIWLTVENWSGPNGTGRLLSRKRIKCHSYVGNFIDLLYFNLGNAGGQIYDINGTLRSVNPTPYLRADAGSGQALYGVQVGTGTAANDVSRYNLAAQIAHGTGAGQLQYGATSIGTPATVGQKRQITVARTFTNASGSSITVNEVGLAILIAQSYEFLIERTLSTNTIAHLASATWTYTISITTS